MGNTLPHNIPQYSKVERMNEFLDWYHNKVRTIHSVIDAETQQRIMNKL